MAVQKHAGRSKTDQNRKYFVLICTLYVFCVQIAADVQGGKAVLPRVLSCVRACVRACVCVCVCVWERERERERESLLNVIVWDLSDNHVYRITQITALSPASCLSTWPVLHPILSFYMRQPQTIALFSTAVASTLWVLKLYSNSVMVSIWGTEAGKSTRKEKVILETMHVMVMCCFSHCHFM